MEQRNENSDADMDGDITIDTETLNIDAIVRDFEEREARKKNKNASALKRIEEAREKKRLEESLRDCYDDDYPDDIE